MKIGIVVTDPADWTAERFIHGLRLVGVEPITIELGKAVSNVSEITCEGFSLFDLDGLLVRDVGGGGLESSVFRFDLLVELECSGIQVVNPSHAIQLAANKHLSYWKLKRSKLPLPLTCVTSEIKEAISFVENLGSAVAKPIFGYKGLDVELIDAKRLHRVSTIIRERGVIYLQEFIPHAGRDVRAFVVGNEVIGAIYRIAPENEWISNLSQGGTPQPCSLTGVQKDLAIRAARALGAAYAGVDLIGDENETFVLEVNGTPSGYGLFAACRVDVTRAIIDLLMNRVRG
ncbi:alpha-L-glutamate ligase [Methanosarcinales archaeon ex4572_44]|nr:MAG: alpha-L-glutamate ligase [Methanosarcinales archaeon ex4484_138]PHP45972.1 MAG: alpha-L-glutamate ligase [Methanosarcinales archaeon ex4572_44]